MPEFTAIILSFACLAAVVALLGAFSNQDLSTWSFPGAVSINAVVAALNTVSKVMMAFALSSGLGQFKWIAVNRRYEPLTTFVAIHDSSQGPLGSLQMLWVRSKGRQVKQCISPHLADLIQQCLLVGFRR